MPVDLSRFFRSRNPADPRVRAARMRDVDRTIELCQALLDDNARGITGQAINVDGGMVMS